MNTDKLYLSNLIHSVFSPQYQVTKDLLAFTVDLNLQFPESHKHRCMGLACFAFLHSLIAFSFILQNRVSLYGKTMCSSIRLLMGIRIVSSVELLWEREKKRASIDTVSKLYVNMFSLPLRKYKENKGSVVWWLYVSLYRKVSAHVLEHLPHSAFSPVIQESLSCSVPRRYLMWWGFGQLSSIQWINSDLPSLLAFVFWNWHLALRGE